MLLLLLKGKYMKMKKVIICILFVLFILAIAVGITLSYKKKTSIDNSKIIEKYIKSKYQNNQFYTVCKIDQKGEWTAYFGKDANYMYIDIFEHDKYFGGTVKDKKDRHTIDVYQFGQGNTLMVVYGLNENKRYSEYNLSIGSDTLEELQYHKNIGQIPYILDIYVEKSEYNYTADLSLK